MNTNVTTSYWDFEQGEVKCFTNELISSKNLENLFTIKISSEQMKKLSDLADFYRDMLIDYREYIKLSNEEIDKIYNGYKKRLECLRKICT